MNGPDDVFVERKGRIERVRDRLFEGEESVKGWGGVQMASEKRLNPWTSRPHGYSRGRSHSSA